MTTVMERDKHPNFDYNLVVLPEFTSNGQILKEALLLGRGEENGIPKLFSEKSTNENISKISEFFSELFKKEGILDSISDISRGVPGEEIFYSNDGRELGGNVSKLVVMSKDLLKAYNKWIYLLDIIEENRNAKPKS